MHFGAGFQREKGAKKGVPAGSGGSNLPPPSGFVKTFLKGRFRSDFSAANPVPDDPSVDRFARVRLSSQALHKALYTMNRAGRNEADIQAAEPQASEQARLSRAHEDGRRPQDVEPSPQAGSFADRRQGRREVESRAQGAGERLPREARIRLGSEIRELLRRGERKRTKHVDVFFSASPVSHARLGLIVPKFGHRIVERNLLKRRLREIGRRSVLPQLTRDGCPVDVLLRARRSAYEADFEGLEVCVLGAMEGVCSEPS